MILSETKAKMMCEHEGCEAQLTVDLALTIGGTWAVKCPNGHGWQLTYAESGVFMTRCPDHKTTITQVAPAGLEVPRGRRH
jgi:hypothetical protein